MKNHLFLFFLILNLSVEAQTKFKIEEKETDTWRSIYSLVDENNRTLRVLDSAKYYMPFSGFEFGYFAVITKKG